MTSLFVVQATARMTLLFVCSASTDQGGGSREAGASVTACIQTGCKIICGVPTTLAVKGLMMIMMIMIPSVSS